ncbi:MAG: DUF4271 domain-containing protein [Bacteroidaceae bacterium]|nr:DUF4271 domain-containing protein [Bacteroidaceae bacterium]
MTDTTVPYCMLNDNIIMSLFILNLVGISYVFLMNGASILERLKCTFYYENKAIPFNDRTHTTKICNILLYSQTIFYSAILITGYLQEHRLLVNDERQTLYISFYAIAIITALLLKRFLYDIVNNILFTNKDAAEWRSLYLFTIKIAGFALFPAIIAILFIPEIPFQYVEIYSILILIAYIYTITSSLIRIIFCEKRNYLDIFLYLCALEFLPMALVWKLILQLNEFITTKI